MPFMPHNFSSGSPADQSAITNVAYRATGLGAVAAPNTWSLTPQFSGRIFVAACGVLTGSGAGTGTIQIIFGTGSAPANGASAGLGTAQGGQQAIILDATGLQSGFSIFTIITGQAVNTALWFDIQQKMSANSLQLQFVNVVAFEL